jgi:class 3 adenylate cyclase
MMSLARAAHAIGYSADAAVEAPMPALPTGTVTIVFTDIEGSTRLWEQFPDAMHGAMARHDALLRQAVEAHNGHVIKTTGEGLHAI